MVVIIVYHIANVVVPPVTDWNRLLYHCFLAVPRFHGYGSVIQNAVFSAIAKGVSASFRSSSHVLHCRSSLPSCFSIYLHCCYNWIDFLVNPFVARIFPLFAMYLTQTKTEDIGGSATTTQFTDAVVAEAIDIMTKSS